MVPWRAGGPAGAPDSIVRQRTTPPLEIKLPPDEAFPASARNTLSGQFNFRWLWQPLLRVKAPQGDTQPTARVARLTAAKDSPSHLARAVITA